MRRVIIFVFAIAITLPAFAQDLLVKRNGDKLRVKIIAINKKKVSYVRQGTEAPVYTIPTTDINYIQYPMGDKDIFNEKGVLYTQSSAQEEQAKSTQERPKRWHGPAPMPDGRTSLPLSEALQAEHRYEVGDIYEKDGIKGIVIIVHDQGRHGIIMSLDEACLAWCTHKRKEVAMIGATNRVDGEQNMKAVEAYIKKVGAQWSDFPAFEWCRKMGEGWYLPAISELWTAGTMYLGGSRKAPKRSVRKHINNNLKLAGGKIINNLMFYHSSTEDDKDKRYSQYSHMSTDLPQIDSDYKAEELFVRAFRKF